MSDDRITVYSPRFSVPGAIIGRGLGTVRISYHAPGEQHPRADWFHTNDGGPRAGRRMGDHDDQPVRYSVSPAMPDAA
jgi:hypothetical protein